jgi:endogenous inhibitor of DNA gyrase (YacG/DUF329 family)
MDRRALCVLCRARPVEPRWRPFCSRRCQQQDQARWADGAYRVETSAEDAEHADHEEHRESAEAPDAGEDDDG